MGEQLTVEIEQSLKEILLRYCEASNESPDSVINRALAEFMTKERKAEDDTWFGLPSEDYFSLVGRRTRSFMDSGVRRGA